MTAFQSLTLTPTLKATGIFVLFIVFTSVTLALPQEASAQEPLSFQVFYDDLSPYGDWVNNPEYGYVWVPRVSPEFVPYATNGYWVFTQVGWTWVSNYSWGWAPFHYGRWFYDSFYGWVWVPGNEWGPGWVTWRRSEGYYGWAPIGPDVDLDVAYGSSYNVPYNRWKFVRDRDFGRTDINNYYVSPSTYTEIINNSTVINNIQVDNSQNVRYNAGPSRAEVENRAGKTFAPVAIRESSSPTQNVKNNQLEIFRPKVQKNISVSQKPAPPKVAEWKGNEPKKSDQQIDQQAKKPQVDQAKKQQEQQQADQAKKQQEQQQADQAKKQQEQQQIDQAKKQQEQQQIDQAKKQQQQQQSDQQAKKQQEQQQIDEAKKQQQQQQSDQQAKKQQEQQQIDEAKKQQQQQQSDQQAKKQPDQQQIDQAKKQHQSNDQTKKQQSQGNSQPTKKQPAKQKASQPQKDSTRKN